LEFSRAAHALRIAAARNLGNAQPLCRNRRYDGKARPRVYDKERIAIVDLQFNIRSAVAAQMERQLGRSWPAYIVDSQARQLAIKSNQPANAVAGLFVAFWSHFQVEFVSIGSFFE